MSRRYWLYALAALGVVALVDLFTSYDLSLGAFYLIPVGIAAMQGSRRIALGFAVLAALVWLAIGILVGHPHTRAFYVYWDALNHLAANLAVAWGLSAWRQQLAQRSRMTAQLGASELSYRQMASDLQAANERLGLAIASGRLGIWDLNLQTMQMDWNDQMFELYGHSKAEVAPSLELWKASLHPEDAAFAQESFLAALRGDQDFRPEFRVVHPGGAIRHIKANALVIRDEAGAPVRVTGLNRDITARKQAEEALSASERRFKGLFQGMTEGVAYHELIYGPEGRAVDYRILSVNPAYSTLVGIPAEAAVGALATHLYGIDPLPNLPTYAQVAETGIPHQMESEFPALGKHFHLSVIAPRKGHFAVIISDLTERKRAEDLVRGMNESLEGLVQQRTLQLEASVREMEAFSYSVAHDLRSPLRAIDGFSHALLEEYGDRLDTEGRRYLERVRHGTQHMGQLIEDLLKLSRTSRGELVRAPLDLSLLAGQVLGDLAAQGRDRRVKVQITPGLKASGDARLVGIALENLLGNAWKFTRDAPAAAIEFGCALQDGEPAFFVRDNGAGFDMQYAGKLFSAFQRMHPPQAFEGSGIGLAIVQRIVHRHGGRVWAEAEPGLGATFHFTLPG